jgi:hypothetical protein
MKGTYSISPRSGDIATTPRARKLMCISETRVQALLMESALSLGVAWLGIAMTSINLG